MILPSIQVQLNAYPVTHTVTGIVRERNHGPILTLAVATWKREGFRRAHPVRDIVTRMRLADLLGRDGYHDLPQNADSAYGVPRWNRNRGDIGTIKKGGTK